MSNNPSKSSPNMLAVVLAGLAALAPFAIDTYLPAFPMLEQDLATNTHAIQQSLTFYLLPYAIMTLWHGAISDSIGRLAAIKWGLGVFILASIGCALAPNVETLWFFRILQGLSGGAGNVVARAMVRDLFEGAQAQRRSCSRTSGNSSPGSTRAEWHGSTVPSAVTIMNTSPQPFMHFFGRSE
ncbi:MAG TPA: MFS transporter, partial [Methylophilaceae bacterium]|nr:MFS transporter [Methylophilaceae bacterium]